MLDESLGCHVSQLPKAKKPKRSQSRREMTKTVVGAISAIKKKKISYQESRRRRRHQNQSLEASSPLVDGVLRHTDSCHRQKLKTVDHTPDAGPWAMARGNQRELARQKNQKGSQAQGKGQRKDDMTHAQRLEHDRKILLEKQAKANAKLATTGESASPASKKS